MALQQCFSGGRKMLLTNLLPRSSTHFRYLISSGLSVKTQSWNNENTSSFLTNSLNKTPSSKSAKWRCLKTLSHNYSQINKDTSGIESSKTNRYYAQDDYGDDNHDDDDDIDRKRIEYQLKDIFTNQKELSSAQWEDLIKLMSLGNSRVTPRSCDAIIMKRCLQHGNYTLGTSYLEHLQQHGRELNLSTLGSYLQLCGECVAQCGEDRVLEYYHRLLSQAKVLDHRLIRNAVIGITATQEWRQAIDLLSCLRKMSWVDCQVYSSIITAAFRSGDYELGWRIFESKIQETQQQTISRRTVSEDSVFLEWMRQCDAVEDRTEKKAMALTLLQKLEDHEVYPSVAVAREVTRLFREGLGWSAHYFKIPKSGTCPSCKHKLKIKGVSEEEFKHLQEEFVPRVLLGSDIFRSTSPEEWSNFQRYVEEEKPFSVVVDGLNASYVQSENSRTTHRKSLRKVMDRALAQHPSGRVLVLIRKHMRKNKPRIAEEDKQRTSFFTLNNMTKDDGFFLYAALQSGLGTKFITSDLLRDHLLSLGEPQLRDAFRRWQRTHQLMPYASSGRVHLMSPAKFSTVAQESQVSGVGSWHVPYDDGAPRFYYELPPTWLCLHPSLALAPPLPPSVSFEPLAYTESTKPNVPPHRYHHHRRSASPKDDHFGVRYRNAYDPTAGRGQQRERQNRHENSTAMAKRLHMGVDDAAAPPKGWKRSMEVKIVLAREVNQSTIFTKK